MFMYYLLRFATLNNFQINHTLGKFSAPGGLYKKITHLNILSEYQFKTVVLSLVYHKWAFVTKLHTPIGLSYVNCGSQKRMLLFIYQYLLQTHLFPILTLISMSQEPYISL